MIINTAKAFLTRQGLRNTRLVASHTIRQFNFASSQYASCFAEIPTPNVDKFRKDAMEYLDRFDGKSWYDDPVSWNRVNVTV